MDKEQVKERIEVFLKAVQGRSDKHFKNDLPNLPPSIYTAEYGSSYCKIVENRHGGGRTVYCFIDLSNGDILKAATWKAPAKIPRGNIFNHDMLKGTNLYGADYIVR